MENNHLFQFNDWPVKKFFIITIIIQLMVLGLTFLKINNINLPFIYEIIIFIYLTFLPGTLILRTLRIHEIGSIPNLLYSLGLSISFIFLIGFLINYLLPFLGYSSPITFFNIFISTYVSIAFLTLLCYILDKNFSANLTITKPILKKELLLIILPPFLAIISTYVMNIYANNILQIFLIMYIAFLIILFNFFNFEKKYYPIAIFSVTLAILLHTSLISNYIWGWDLHTEFYLASSTIQNGYWNFTHISNYNAMMSITLLAPIYAIMLKMNLIWVFKIVYPIIFSFLPLGLYYIYEKQTNSRIAFFSSFFLVLFFTFYYELVAIARQEIAELFFLLLIMVMISSEIKNVKKSLLLIIFGASLVVSHYSLSYIYIFFMITAFLIIFLSKKINLIKISDSLPKFQKKDVISVTFILFFITFSLAWYIYISGSSIFEAMINIQNQIITALSTELFNPEASQGMNVLMETSNSLLHNFSRYLQIFAQILIAFGLIRTIIDRKKYHFDDEYLVFALIAVLILILSILVPYFASSLNISRFYHISLIILSPFCIIGGCALLSYISSYIQIFKNIEPLKLVGLLIITLFLLNSGGLYQIFNEKPSGMALDHNMDFPKFNEYEIASAKWLKNTKYEYPIYADNYRYLLLISNNLNYTLLNPKFKIYGTSYIYLGSYNNINNKFLVINQNKAIKKYAYLKFDLESTNKIYDNGKSSIKEMS